jgi:hypothetical protein
MVCLRFCLCVGIGVDMGGLWLSVCVMREGGFRPVLVHLGLCDVVGDLDGGMCGFGKAKCVCVSVCVKERDR